MSQSSDPRPLRLWSALEFRDYRVLWVSSIAWMLTQQLRLLVTAVWLFEATGSAAQLGLIGAIQLVVQIPALLFGGALADRIDRKLLMAGTQAVTFGVVAMLAVLASSGELDPWHVYLATAITSVTTVLGQPARSALTAVVVPRNYLMHAVATNNVTIQIGSIAAPLLFATTSAQRSKTTLPSAGCWKRIRSLRGQAARGPAALPISRTKTATSSRASMSILT